MVFILCGCCLASSLPKYNFDALFAEFSSAINAGEDFNSILNRLNVECRAFTSGNSNSFIRKSVAIKEEIIDLLMERTSTSFSFETPEIQAFRENLIQDITDHGEFFSLKNFESIIRFLVKASSDCNLNKFMGLVTRMLPRMTASQAKKMMKRLEMADRKMQKEAAQNQSRIYGRFMEIFDSKDKSNDLCALNPVIPELMRLDFDDYPERLQPILSGLKKNINKIMKDPNCFEHLVSFILSDKVIEALPENYLLDTYAIIMYLSSKAPGYNEKFNSISSESREKLQRYQTKVEETAKIYKLIGFSINLNENSEDYEFTLAQRSLSTLKAKSRESKLTKEVLLIEHENFSDSFKNWFKSPKIENHAYHLSIRLGLLYFDLVEGKDKLDASSNIMGAIGLHITQHENESLEEHLSEYIQEILPNIDEMCELTLKSILELKSSQNPQLMNALIRAFRLNPVRAHSDVFVDRLCAQYISDIFAEKKHFLTLKEVKMSDERGVHLTAFMTFLQNFVSNPDSSKLPYLEEYFAFLASMKFLSKTELLFIENIFAPYKS